MATSISRSMRFDLRLPMAFRLKGEHAWNSGTTLNISDSGVLFQAARLLEPGCQVYIDLALPVNADERAMPRIACNGIVIRSTSDNAMAVSMCGGRLRRCLH